MANPIPALIERNKDFVRYAISQYVGQGDEYCIVDFPDHSNVGDSLIWLGEIQLLREITGKSPTYTCSAYDFDADSLRSLSRGGTIFFHGGGNLGDIYPLHMDLRAKLARAFPDRQIVQLPQSLHFSSSLNAASFRSVVSEHGAFKLMVRDKASLRIAVEDLGAMDAQLVPDCAFGLGPLPISSKAQFDILYMMRRDEEKVDVGIDSLIKDYPGPVEDWLDEPSDTNARSYKALWNALTHGDFSPQGRSNWQRTAVAWRRAHRGIAQLSRSRLVVCDRLHVHILCVLLGIPHIALDNSYRKLHNFIEAWTSDCSLVTMAENLEDVRRALESSKLRVRA